MLTIAVKSFLELCAIGLLIYGYYHEEDIIEIEQMLPKFFRYHWRKFLKKIKNRG